MTKEAKCEHSNHSHMLILSVCHRRIHLHSWDSKSSAVFWVRVLQFDDLVDNHNGHRECVTHT